MTTGPWVRVCWGLAGVALLLSLAALAYDTYRQYRERTRMDARMARIVAPGSQPRADCGAWARQKPLVLLALGQSNAANHGSPGPVDAPPVALVAGSECLWAEDPLPGATGQGGSIWRRLPSKLRPALGDRPVVLSVLALDASSMAEWTRPDGALAARLAAQVRTLRQLGLPPDFVLWQQGEADARLHTSGAHYLRGLQSLAAQLQAAGSEAPLLLARSSRCRAPADPDIGRALEQAWANNPRLLPGPDTDSLLDDSARVDGCHLNGQGLQRAAQAWADVITARAGLRP